MSEDWFYSEGSDRPSWVRIYLLPLAALVVVVAVVSILVLTGVAKSDEPRVGPQEAPTTLPTVEVTP